MRKLQFKVSSIVPVVSKLLLVTLVIMHICQASTDARTDRQILKHRRRRQAGDIMLMNLNAENAVRGTTKPAWFYRRIGKKWSSGSGAVSQPISSTSLDNLDDDSIVEPLILDPDEYLNWLRLQRLSNPQ